MFLHTKPRANGSNIVHQQLPTLLDVTCYVRLYTLLHVVAYCWELLLKVKKPVRLLATSETDATTPNNVGPAMIGVVASVCT